MDLKPEVDRSRITKLFIVVSFSAQVLGLCAQSELYRGEMNKALNKVLTKDVENGDFQGSLVYFFKHEPDSTIYYTNKYLNGENRNPQLVDFCLFFRGRSFIDKRLFPQAIEATTKISKKFPFQSLVRMQLGTIHLERGEYQEALTHFWAVDSLRQFNEKVIDKSIVYHNIGVCNLHIDNYELSEIYLMKALDLQQECKDTLLVIGSLMDLGNLFYTQYLDEKAIPYFQAAYDLSKQISDVELKHFTALNMAIVAENKKNYAEALSFYKEYDRWKDSLNNQQKVWDIAQLEKRFITERSKEKIEVLKLESKTRSAQRNGFIYSSGFLLILLLTSIYFYRQKLKTNRIIASQKRELEEISATKDQLFSIVSHDLRSSVNAFRKNSEELSNTISSKNRERIEHQLSKNKELADSTYSLLDNLLNWALLQTNRILFIPESVSLARLCDQVAYNYSAMMIEKKITFSNALTQNSFAFVDQESIKIVVRNLLDNAIKFTPENGKITIYEINSTHNGFAFCIEDSGKGISRELITKMDSSTSVILDRSSLNTSGSGLGLQLCKSMIQKNRGALLIESEEGNGTQIKIILPKSS